MTTANPTYTGGAYAQRGMIVQNDNQSISSPHNIVWSILGARTFYLQDRINHLPRIALYAAIEGLKQGNPPYDPIDLAKHGLDHITNFNDLSALSIIQRGCVAYWNLLYNSENLFTFNFKSDDPSALEISEILSSEFTKILKKWKPFRTCFNTLIEQLVTLGISPVFWKDERDWRWNVVELSRFFIPSQASTNMEENTRMEFESVFTAQYLFEVYMNCKDKEFIPPSGQPITEEKYNELKDQQEKTDSTTSPWNKEALGKLLLFYANSSVKPADQILNMMDLQRRIQNGDFLWESIFSDGFRLVSLLHREYDGQISHYMFDRNRDNGEFLFFVDRQYKNFEEAIVIFTGSPGAITIHSNRGLGHKIYPICQALMQNDCSVMDMAKMASTPFIKTLNTGGKEFEAIRIYPGVPTNIGAAEFVQTNFGANIPMITSLNQYMIGKLNYNTANSGDNPGIPDGDQGSISADQAKMESFREFSIPKNTIQHFYSDFDCVGEKMAIKMLHSKLGYPGYEYALEWAQNCAARGVPPEVFETKDVPENEMPPQLEVKATRVAGDGSTLSMILGLEYLKPYTPSLNPLGQKNYLKEVFKTIMGPDHIKAFIQDDPALGAEISLAATENAVMGGALPGATVSPDNDHQTHITTHFALANNLVLQVRQEQMSPIDADKRFALLVPHLGQHIQIYSQSIFAKPFIEGIMPAFKELDHFSTQNRIAAEKLVQDQLKTRQADQQATDQTMTDTERKDFVAKADVARADYKVKAQVDRAASADETRGKVADHKVVLQAQNTAKKIQLDHSAKNGVSEVQNTSTQDLQDDLSTYEGARPAALDFENNPVK